MPYLPPAPKLSANERTGASGASVIAAQSFRRFPSFDPDTRRVYVADRANGRIQVFDRNGNLDQWPNIRSAYQIFMTADHHLWIADGVTDKFLKYDLNGKLMYSWGTHGTFPGTFWAVHQFSVDVDGNLYAAETFGGRTQKFMPSRERTRQGSSESIVLVGLDFIVQVPGLHTQHFLRFAPY